MKSQRVWLLLVSLVPVCGLIGCGEKPQPVVEKPEAVPEEPKAVVSEPHVVEKPKPGIEDLKAIVSEAQKEYGEKLGLEAVITNSIGMKLVLIPPGEFMMGSPESDDEAGDNEKPPHEVKITKPFYLGGHEVTQEQYEKVMGENPSNFKGAGNPVERVSWNDAAEFCKRLSAEEGKTYRLPTEAEWEYACRAGTTTWFSFGDDEESLGEYAWYRDDSEGKTHPVGGKKPNAWGLDDMHGNVWEWCQDWYDGAYYKTSSTDDPPGPETSSVRVFRGGGWWNSARFCRAAFRGGNEPQYRSGNLGFRVAAVAPGE
jgi:formylglycine-generating enzyme required for sulfatase activity